MQDIFQDGLAKWGCELTEFNAEEDHVHLLIEAHPSLDLSRLAGNLKTISARHLRREFEQHLKHYFWKPLFWSRAYSVSTTGGALLDSDSFSELSRRMPRVFVQRIQTYLPHVSTNSTSFSLGFIHFARLVDTRFSANSPGLNALISNAG